MSDLIVKSNKIIEAQMYFKTNEYKFILCLLSRLKKNDTEFKMIQLSIKEFKEMLDVKGENSYGRVKKYCESLAFKGISITEPNSPRGLYITWFSYIKSEVGYVEICFNNKLKEFLLMTNKNFTSYYLKNIIILKSFYSIRIYELLKQYERIGTRELDVSNLRFMLGIGENKYKEFYKFRNKILINSMNEINSKTDIKFFFEEIKKGRKVFKLRFFISNNVSEKVQDDLVKKFESITGYIIHKDRLNDLIKEKGIDIVEYYVNNFYKFIQYGNVKDPVKLFYKAVKEEYIIPKEPLINKSEKPIQSRNFDQREYDDDFFESLYDNFKE
jgi:plasmid replication initiation protein